MPATAEEIAALNTLRAMEGRPPLAPHEIEALADDPSPARADDPTMSEDEALAYLRGVAGPGPASDNPSPAAPLPPAPRPAPAPAAVSGLVVPGGPLTDRERVELAQMEAEYREDGRGPLTETKAAELVALWRSRAA